MYAFDLSVVMEGVAGTGRLVCIQQPSSHECGTYTFVKHDTRFIHSMDHLHCHTSLRSFRRSTDLVFKSCRGGVTMKVVGPTHKQLVCHGKIVIEQYDFLLLWMRNSDDNYSQLPYLYNQFS
jgi:hypothetical protein